MHVTLGSVEALNVLDPRSLLSGRSALHHRGHRAGAPVAARGADRRCRRRVDRRRLATGSATASARDCSTVPTGLGYMPACSAREALDRYGNAKAIVLARFILPIVAVIVVVPLIPVALELRRSRARAR